MLLLLLNTLTSLLMLPLARALLDLRRGVESVPTRPAPPDAPFVTAIVPARNEELAIERCVRSLLEQQYPRFEVVVMNDRSTDRTGEILDRLAADERLRVLEGRPLPDGWVGKCWALHQASREARGDWLLFVDADTHHQPLMLASTVAYANEHGVDLLSLGPYQELGSFWERALLPAIFGVILMAGGSLAEVNDPKRPLAKANGQFLLFRRDAYRRIGGHESVRDEIVDDFALARRVKGTGHVLRLLDGHRLVSTRMYRSLREIWEGFSKNSYFEARRHPAGPAAGVVLPWLVVAFPIWLFGRLARCRLRGSRLVWPEPLMLLQSAIQCVLIADFSIQIARFLHLPVRWAAAVPGGLLFFSVLMLNSAARVLSGRGVTWKGRRYDRATAR